MNLSKIEELRKNRGKDGMSRSTLARKIGVDRSYIYRLEKGQRKPSLETAIKIANFFNVTLDRLLS